MQLDGRLISGSDGAVHEPGRLGRAARPAAARRPCAGRWHARPRRLGDVRRPDRRRGRGLARRVRLVARRSCGHLRCGTDRSTSRRCSPSGTPVSSPCRSNARLHRDEIAYILDDSGSTVVVTDADHADDVESLVSTVESLRAVVVAPGERWNQLTASPADRRSSTGCRTIRPGCSTRAAPPVDPRAPRSHTATCSMMSLSYFADIDPVMPRRQHPPCGAAVARFGPVRAAARGPRGSECRAGVRRHRRRRTRSRSWIAGPACRSSPLPIMVKRLAADPAIAGADLSVSRRSSTAARRCTWPTWSEALDVFGPRLAQIYGQGETPMTITALSKADHADRDHPRWAEPSAERGRSPAPTSSVRVVDGDGPRTPRRRDRRGGGSWRRGHGRLLEPTRGHRRGAARRLAAHRRRRQLR